MTINERLQSLRKQKGFSQKAMAAKLNKSPSAYSRMEKGEIKIALEELPDIAKILDCTLDDLLQDLGTTDIQQHKKNAYDPCILKSDKGILAIFQLLQKIMEHQEESERGMQYLMKEILTSLKK